MHERSGAVEALEQRLQLSSANFVDGRLSIEVTGSDRVQVSASHGQTLVTFNNVWSAFAESDNVLHGGANEDKGIRWLLLKNPENLKQTARGDERSRLAEDLKLNEPLAQAYYLKDELRQFWQQSSKSAAARFLDDWCRRAEATGVRILRTMRHTLRGHRVGLLNWYDHPCGAF
jgi:hypothetical protein